MAEYETLAQNTLKHPDAVLVKSHLGEIQYEAYNFKDSCHVVIDRKMDIVGCFGHKTPTRMQSCLQGQMRTKASLS
jgi:hypothetical protein